MTDWAEFDPKLNPRSEDFFLDVAGQSRPALFFVPGWGASTLSEDLGSGVPGKVLWPPFDIAAGTRNLGRLQDVIANDNEPKVPSAGSWVTGSYQELFNFLESIGYERDRTYWVFPYDFTQSNRNSGDRFGKFILDTQAAHGFTSCDIINHSNGGLVTRRAMQNASVAALVDKTIYLASPHYGAPKAYFVLHPFIEVDLSKNFILDYLIKSAIAYATGGLSASKLASRLALKMDSVFELMPDKFYFDRGMRPLTIDDWGGNPPDPATWDRVYKQGDWQFDAKVHEKVNRAMDFKESLTSDLPGDTLSLYSPDQDTDDQVEFNDWDKDSWNNFDSPADSGAQKGDGTVPTLSANPLGNNLGRPIPGESHSTLPNSLQTFLHIAYFLVTHR